MKHAARLAASLSSSNSEDTCRARRCSPRRSRPLDQMVQLAFLAFLLLLGLASAGSVSSAARFRFPDFPAPAASPAGRPASLGEEAAAPFRALGFPALPALP